MFLETNRKKISKKIFSLERPCIWLNSQYSPQSSGYYVWEYETHFLLRCSCSHLLDNFTLCFSQNSINHWFNIYESKYTKKGRYFGHLALLLVTPSPQFLILHSRKVRFAHLPLIIQKSIEKIHLYYNFDRLSVK